MSKVGTCEGESPGELTQVIKEIIKERGPITFADFMRFALYHPDLGYYTSKSAVWGSGGDYITSSDVSPVFAKLICKQAAEVWKELDSPDEFSLIEVGGGRGLLLKGLLSSAREFYPDFYAALDVSMVERGAGLTSDSLDGKPIRWYNEASDVSSFKDGFIYSNELIDALPFHRVVGDEDTVGGLKEIFVVLDSDGGFTDFIGEPSTDALSGYFSSLGVDLLCGQEAEVSLEAPVFIETAAALMERGVVLTIDYGLPARELYSSDRQGTLLCHYRHTINDDPYSRVGLQDITAHVDFTTLLRVGEKAGLDCAGFTTQLNFLFGLGIAEELQETTGEGSEGLDAVSHNQSIKGLIMPGGMGDTFKMLAQYKGIDKPFLAGFSFKDSSSIL